ncbi:MAG TPA: hypothetical protein VMW52_09330 [Phycisphaerae bacterium]|nr:hypothetical protein [Phycisphaerae bacterium]
MEKLGRSARRTYRHGPQHVHRTMRRLGLIGPKTGADQAHEVLGKKVPPDLVYAFHVLLIEHGRRTCRARRPDCPACALARICPSARPAARS